MSLQEFMQWAVPNHGCELSDVPEKHKHGDLNLAKLERFVVIDKWSPDKRERIGPTPVGTIDNVDDFYILELESTMPDRLWVTPEGARFAREESDGQKQRESQATLTKRKPGRKSKPEHDQKIADEYTNGLDNGLWESHTEYLRKRHLKRWNNNKRNAQAWFSTLLKRVKQMNGN